MNEYKFHIGDYRRDAGHLTVEEAGIYRYLIDESFLQETPLSPDIHLLSRKMRLTSDQKPLLVLILDEFFVLTDDGYVHDRVSRELSRIYDVSETARANINKRWAKKNGNTPVKKKDTPVLPANNGGNTGDILPSNPVTQQPSNPVISSAGADSSEAAEPVNNKPRAKPIPYQKIIDLFHEYCPMLPRVVTITSARKGAIKARWQAGMNTREFWENYFKHVAESDFLTGKKPPIPPRTKPMIADIDFLLRESTIAFMQEGKYDD